jgi:hypothetical protein
MLFDPGSHASLPAKIRAGLQHQHQVTAMFCPQLSCPPDHAIRVPRRPGTRSDFFKFCCEQPEFPGALYHKLLGHFGVRAQRFQVKNQHISHRDLLATPGIARNKAQCPVSSPGGFFCSCGNYSAQKLYAGVNGARRQALNKVDAVLSRAKNSKKDARPLP